MPNTLGSKSSSKICRVISCGIINEVKRTHVKELGEIFATWSLQRALFAIVVVIVATVLGVAVSQVRADDNSGSESTDERIITLYDRGVEQSFMTTAKTVGDALKEAGIEVDARDRVEPSLSETLVADKYSVNVYRARPLLIVDGSRRNVVMTAAQVPYQIAKDAELTLHPEDIATLEQSNNILVDRATERFVVDRATEFKLTLYGETFTARTQAETVGDMLKEKDINLGDKDKVSAHVNDPIEAGMSLRVWREGKQTITVKEEIDFDVEQIQDANREAGYRQVRTAGEKGEAVVTYEVTIRDGKEVSRKKITSVTKKAPVKQVEVVGAKFKYTGGPLTEAQMTALGTCESGMTATRNSGNGFYGAFQFMPSTWRSVAPAPYNNQLPHEAPLDVQKQAVQNLLSGSNIFNQFPGCASQMRSKGIL